jgi:hypothetical protein
MLFSGVCFCCSVTLVSLLHFYIIPPCSDIVPPATLLVQLQSLQSLVREAKSKENIQKHKLHVAEYEALVVRLRAQFGDNIDAQRARAGVAEDDYGTPLIPVRVPKVRGGGGSSDSHSDSGSESESDSGDTGIEDSGFEAERKMERVWQKNHGGNNSSSSVRSSKQHKYNNNNNLEEEEVDAAAEYTGSGGGSERWACKSSAKTGNGGLHVHAMSQLERQLELIDLEVKMTTFDTKVQKEQEVSSRCGF